MLAFFYTVACAEGQPDEIDVDLADGQPVVLVEPREPRGAPDPADLTVAVSGGASAGALGETVVYAVRHAEKESEGDDPGLTEEGSARALALADVLMAAPLVAVYATELARTQLTVAPTAAGHDLPVITDVDAEEELGAHVLSAHRGDTLLHAGHSYTLPSFFFALGLFDPPNVDGYGQLFRVRIDLNGGVSVEESRFGVAE
ncbi:MAG: hypothetical protein EXR71_03895 [Myxococcales bacterium]|nr:hypothetical protein [Myxococcales bacterium]